MISVIMPSLNPNIVKIKNTLDSILENKGNYEIILILQRTDDDKVEALKKYFFNENKLHIIIDDGIGISRARNIAIKNSNGDWFLLLDDDIYIEKHIIEDISKILDDKELFYYGNAMITDTEEHYVRFYMVDKELSIWDYNRVCSISLIINKKVFEEIGLFDENLGSGTIFGSSEESDLILRAFENGFQIKYMKNYIVYHEKAEHTLSKIEKYAMGSGALYKKQINCMNVKLYLKFLIDFCIRIIFLLTFKKKRYLFIKGFIKGFLTFKAKQ